MKKHFGKYIGPTLVDEAEPITAWRVWRVNEKGKQPLLHSSWTQIGRVWLPQVATMAECVGGSGKCHIAMGAKCECGLWACKALSGLIAHSAVALYPVGVLGRVSLWGFVHVYEHGFRAQLGRPRDLWLGNKDGVDFAERLHRAYRVPVSLGLPMELLGDDTGLVRQPMPEDAMREAPERSEA